MSHILRSAVWSDFKASPLLDRCLFWMDAPSQVDSRHGHDPGNLNIDSGGGPGGSDAYNGFFDILSSFWQPVFGFGNDSVNYDCSLWWVVKRIPFSTSGSTLGWFLQGASAYLRAGYSNDIELNMPWDASSTSFGSKDSGSWYSVVVSLDKTNTTASAFVRGGATVNQIETGRTPNSTLQTGLFGLSSSIGRVARLGVWKRPLSQSEADELYDSGNYLTYANIP